MRASISSVPMIPFNEIVQGSVHHRGETALCIIGAKLRSHILALPSWESFNRKHGWAREQFSANSMIALKAVMKSTGVNESLYYLLIPPNSASQIKKKNKPQPWFSAEAFFLTLPKIDLFQLRRRPASSERKDQMVERLTLLLSVVLSVSGLEEVTSSLFLSSHLKR